MIIRNNHMHDKNNSPKKSESLVIYGRKGSERRSEIPLFLTSDGTAEREGEREERRLVTVVNNNNNNKSGTRSNHK